MKPVQKALQLQAKSRANIREAVARYVALRAGDGAYADTFTTTNREGRTVEVMVRLDIVSTDVVK